ncbi:MAG: hypothetical protein GY719_22580 [bacterium]|nr:hypothetical protein [bacterium]
MSFQLSATVTDLQKQGISVADSGKTNAKRVADAIVARFSGRSRRPLPDLVGIQLGLARLVEDDMQQLLALDTSHVHEVVGKRLQLQVRNESVTVVFGILTGIRDVVTGTYGQTTRVDLFGNVSAVPQEPVGLHRLGVRVHGRLLDADFRLPKVRFTGFPPLEREKVAAGLKKPLDRLGTAVSTLSLERKDVDVSLLDKNAGVEEFRRTVRFVAGCLSSLYGLAGFDDLAARIRAKRRAPRRPTPDGSGGENVAPEGRLAKRGSSESPTEADDTSEEDSSDDDRGDSSLRSASDDSATPAGPTGPIGIVS